MTITQLHYVLAIAEYKTLLKLLTIVMLPNPL